MTENGARPIDAALNNLSSRLDICAPLLCGKILYLDYPIYENIGDLLIWSGAKTFLNRHKKKILGQYNISNIGPRMRNHLQECTTICFQGGGNLGDLWPHHQKFREEIIEAHPHKRIVILPQSVHFDNPAELDKACTVFRKHPDLHIFLRDKNSLATLQAKGLPNLQLCPDMAHALWGKFDISKPTNNEPLYLLRRDKEESYLPLDIAAARNLSFDWGDLIKGWTKYAFRIGLEINHMDARLYNLLPAYTAWSLTANLLIHQAINLLKPHETIVTNRLHAMILATLLDRKSIVFDNSYGKISHYINTWMSDISNVNLQAPPVKPIHETA